MTISPLFSPAPALLGGVLIGLSAVLLWIGIGRTAGISGILGGLATARRGDIAWRVAFLAGLIAGATFYQIMTSPAESVIATPGLMFGGFLVGFGTRLGGGCTSGHGVCGTARLSRRSLAATSLFTFAAMVTVALLRQRI